MAIAPAARRYGSSLTLATAISFLTGLKIYHEDSTRKNRTAPNKESLVKDFSICFVKRMSKFVKRISKKWWVAQDSNL